MSNRSKGDDADSAWPLAFEFVERKAIDWG
jgi:hypothetical protein